MSVSSQVFYLCLVKELTSRCVFLEDEGFAILGEEFEDLSGVEVKGIDCEDSGSWAKVDATLCSKCLVLLEKVVHNPLWLDRINLC